MPDNAPDSRPTMLPPDPSERASQVVSITPAQPRTTAQTVPVVVQVLDRIGEIVGVIALAVICIAGKLSGEATAGAIVLLLIGQTGVRSRGSAALASAASVGAIGSVILLALPLVQGLARARGLAVVTLVVLAAGVAGCPSVIREPPLAAPPPGCTQGATICHAGGPWVCGAGGEWSQADRACDRLGSVCCVARSPYGGTRAACVPETACVATDGGAP